MMSTIIFSLQWIKNLLSNLQEILVIKSSLEFVKVETLLNYPLL
jgi:hypothetical protein